MCLNKSCAAGQGSINLVINMSAAPQNGVTHGPIQTKISIDLSSDQPQTTCPHCRTRSSGSQSGDYYSASTAGGSESGSGPYTPSTSTQSPHSPPSSSSRPLAPPPTDVQDVDPDAIYMDDGGVPMDIDDVEMERVSRQLERVSFDAEEGVDEDGDVTMTDSFAEEDVDVEMQDVSSW